jgi:hypothetical protein
MKLNVKKYLKTISTPPPFLQNMNQKFINAGDMEFSAFDSLQLDILKTILRINPAQSITGKSSFRVKCIPSPPPFLQNTG